MASRFAWVWVLLLGACSTEPAGESADVILDIEFDRPRHRVGRLIGWNIGAGSRYSPEDGARHPEWRTPETTESLRRLSEIRPANGDRPVVRFSGLQIDGAIGLDGYHFFDFADPESEPMPSDNVAPFETMAMIDEIDAEPLIMLNFGSGTAAEAANYAIHLAGTDEANPFVAARVFWGRTEPWPVTLYEIANEIYEAFNTGYLNDGQYSYANPEAANGGDPDWFGRPASSPHHYRDRALEYVDAVLAVQPSARFYIPLTQSTWTGWGGPAESIPVLAPLLERPEVLGVVVHQYVIDDGARAHGWVKAEDAWPLSSGDFYRPLFEELRILVNGLDREAPLEITVTEYLGAALDPMGSVYAADMSVADMLLLYADTGVDLALEHLTLAEDPRSDPIVRNWHKPFFTNDGVVINRPAFEITKLISDHLWHYVATTTEIEMPVEEQPLDGGGYEYVLVRALSFASEDGRSGSVLLLNRDLNAARTVEMVLEEGETVSSAEVIAPTDIWIDTLEVSASRSPLAFEQGGNRVRLTLPAHSLAAVAVDRGVGYAVASSFKNSPRLLKPATQP